MRTETIVNILINGQHYKLDDDEMTGAQIKALAEIPYENQLYLEASGPGDDDPVGNDEVIELKNGDRFYDMPPGNFG